MTQKTDSNEILRWAAKVALDREPNDGEVPAELELAVWVAQTQSEHPVNAASELLAAVLPGYTWRVMSPDSVLVAAGLNGPPDELQGEWAALRFIAWPDSAAHASVLRAKPDPNDPAFLEGVRTLIGAMRDLPAVHDVWKAAGGADSEHPILPFVKAWQARSGDAWH